MKTSQSKKNLWIPDDLWLQIAQRAKQRKVSSSEFIRTACEKYLAALKRAEDAAREAANG